MPPYGRGHNKLAITQDWNPVTLNPITGGGADVLDGSFLGACVWEGTSGRVGDAGGRCRRERDSLLSRCVPSQQSAPPKQRFDA